METKIPDSRFQIQLPQNECRTGPRHQCSEPSLQTSLNAEEIKANLRSQEIINKSDDRNYGHPIYSVKKNTGNDVYKMEGINIPNEGVEESPNPLLKTRHNQDDPNTRSMDKAI